MNSSLASMMFVKIKPTPTMEDAFNMIENERSQKALVQVSPVFSLRIVAESSAMVAHQPQKGDQRGNQPSLRCDHCNKNGHTQEKCWKLHGRLVHSKQRPRDESKGLMTGNYTNENHSMNLEELTMLRRILDRQSSDKQCEDAFENTTPSATLTYTGNSLGERDWQS